MVKSLKYILVGDSRAQEHLKKEENTDIKLGGLYQWANAFRKYGSGGTIEPYWRKEDLEKFDVIHINMTPSNIQHISWIRKELGFSTSIKIICNIDIDLTLWSNTFSYWLLYLEKALEQADILFHVEYKGADVLSHMLNRKIEVCPHPVDVSGLYDYIAGEREPMIGTLWHRYTGESLIPYIAQKNIPLRRVLFGYNSQKPVVSNAGMYDEIIPYQNYQDHIREIAKSKIGMDLYSGFSYGRGTIEFAGLGIPSVVSSTIGASWLFPDTTVHPFDTRKAEEITLKLSKDEEFANNVIKTAHDRCKHYSLKNSYDRMCEILI